MSGWVEELGVKDPVIFRSLISFRGRKGGKGKIGRGRKGEGKGVKGEYGGREGLRIRVRVGKVE